MGLTEVEIELAAENGDKAKLMTRYSSQLQKILDQYGGNLSDLPMDRDHIYHKIQDKIRLLGSLDGTPRKN